MRSKRPSLYQQALKEIRRLEKAARRVEKRGYTFDLPFRRTRTGKEKTRFTAKEVEYLKGLKTKDLYQYATYQGISGVERRKQERSEAGKRAYRTKKEMEQPFEFDARKSFQEFQSVTTTIIENFLDRAKFVKLNGRYDREQCEDAYNYVVDVINRLSNDPEVGRNGLAWALEEANRDGIIMDIHLSYWWQIRGNMAKLVPYLPKRYEDDVKIINFSDSEDDEEPMPELAETDWFMEIFGK